MYDELTRDLMDLSSYQAGTSKTFAANAAAKCCCSSKFCCCTSKICCCSCCCW